MSYLIDTNVLLRSRDADSPIQGICATAIQHLLGSDADLFVCTQVLAEYWVVATRPREVNGMGLSPQAAAREIDEILSAMETLVEPKDGPVRWHDIVVSHSIVGKPAHDARLVALMLSHGVTHVLTLNASDFARYPEITVVAPQQISANKRD